MSQSRSHGPTVRGRHAGAAVVALAGSLALSTVVAGAQAGPAYLAVDGWSAEAVSSQTVRVSASTNAAIPRQADEFIAGNAIVGLAWADLDTGTALVATIHPAIGRDSKQLKDGWHVHTVQLAGGATAPNDFCLVAVLTTPTAGIRIQDDTMTIDLAAAKLPLDGDVAIDDLDAAAGFTVHGGDTGCDTGLGVRVRT
jgi:hypothetical protein